MKRLFIKTKNSLREVRHLRVRKALKGTASAPRLSVFRSLKGMIAQVIDDETGKTLCYTSSQGLKVKKIEGKTTKVAAAFAVGEKIAELAKAKGISAVVFDRGGYRYHGRVQAVADGARAGGLKF
ncbi:MAG: 50S ribosomal protein L18 [Patescibacteria group bacterium]|jgi:large subunit ribosomal protein L18